MTRVARWLVAVAVAAPSCDKGAGPGSAIDHLEISLTPTRSSYPVPDTVRARVVAFSEDGTPVPMGGTLWRSRTPTIASVNANSGLIQTLTRGEAIIEAEVDGVTAQIQVSVRGILHTGYIIDANETWRVADTPHVVQNYISVGGIYNLDAQDTGVVTIEAGATVRFRKGAGLLFADIEPGALVILPGAPVVMEGDSAAPGFWAGLAFDGPGRSQLRNLTIRHCGAATPSGNRIACIAAAGSFDGKGPNLLFDGVTITGAQDGIGISHWVTIDPSSRDLSIEHTTGHMATLSPQVVAAFPRGGHFTDNVEREFRITNGLVERSATWTDLGAPARLVGGVLVTGSARPRLTLAPGFTLRADPAGSIAADRFVAGAPGGAAVVLESTGNGWGGIAFGNGSALYNVSLRDCGLPTTPCLSVGDTGLVVEDVTIRGARSTGVLLGIGAKFGSASRNLTITEGGGVPVETRAEGVASLPSGVYRPNAIDAIRVRWGAISQHVTWPAREVSYLLSEGLEIRSSLSPDSASLTLAPGAVVQVGAGMQVSVGTGALYALGSPTAPILFTSATPGVAGSWVGIALGGDARARLEYVEIQDAGAGPSGYAGALRMAVDPGGVLRNSVIRRSADCGIVLSPWVGPAQWTDNYADAAFGNSFFDVAGPAMCPAP